MSEPEYMAIQWLKRVSFGGHTYKRAFAGQLAMLPASEELSPRQCWYLWQVAWFFRKQLPSSVVDVAECNIIGCAPRPLKWKSKQERGLPYPVLPPPPLGAETAEPYLPLFAEAAHG